MLNFVTKTVHEIDYGELETFVRANYDLPDYDFVAVEECGNDSQHSFDVTRDWEDYEDEEWGRFVASGGSESYRNDLLFNRLVKDNHLPSGTYLVTVCW